MKAVLVAVVLCVAVAAASVAKADDAEALDRCRLCKVGVSFLMKTACKLPCSALEEARAQKVCKILITATKWCVNIIDRVTDLSPEDICQNVGFCGAVGDEDVCSLDTLGQVLDARREYTLLETANGLSTLLPCTGVCAPATVGCLLTSNSTA
eukprot:TRINITY_DN4933_c0_g1_i1.p2 TRINITY_DN4933_c0_g1~~TRINITY_DN4933_c0_g1_i1.p2  ORF type:complete len:153 (-),score=59.50 TRINITY_DN4933_c0_g1_i1:152-610(-)